MKTRKTRKRKLGTIAIMAAVTLLGAMANIHYVHAATIAVTNTDDSGAGSLRQALADAVDGDTIDATGAAGTILLTTGQLVVDRSVTILGPGPANLTVDGNAASRVFYVAPGVAATISSLTISNGLAFGINFGGGIYNDHSTLTVSNCTLSGNSANVGGVGGGIYNQSGSAALSVSASTFSSNSADLGGGIYNDGFQGSATLSVSTSTFSGNSGGDAGGGIYNDGFDGSATLSVSASTFSGNSAEFGGGILNSGFDGSATLSVSASTFSGNSANAGGGIFNTSGALEIGDTILNVGASGENIRNFDDGTVTSRGYNLSSDDASAFLNQSTDQNGINPLLGPLADNGGPTQTHALLPGSPAIDQGNLAAIPELALNTDQRGLPRPDDHPAIANAPGSDGSDIGAFEVQVPVADLLVSLGVDKTSVKQGEQLTYTITVQNFGPDTAGNVIVNDTLSSGTTFVSAQANMGTFTEPPVGQTGVVSWQIGDMLAEDEESAQIKVTVLVKGRTTITNTASGSTDSSDPNPANNSAAITVSVAPGSSGKKK